MAKEEGLTKKQFKELRKLEKMQTHALEQKNNTIKWVAIGVVSVIFLVLFVGIIAIAKNKNNPQTASGKAQFADNGHARMLNKNGTDASVSAIPSQKVVTLIEYGDLECPACKAYHPLVNQLLAAFPGQLKLIFKNFPLTTIHHNAMAGAIAAEAAGKQGKYFQFVDMAYDKQDTWGELDDPQPQLLGFAKSLGLNMDQFKKDQNDADIVKLINDENNEGIKNGVTGTPSFFVDGKKIENPQSIDAFKKIISDELKSISGNSPQTSVPAATEMPLQ